MKRLLLFVVAFAIAVPLWQVELAVRAGVATVARPQSSVLVPSPTKCETGKCPQPPQPSRPTGNSSIPKK